MGLISNNLERVYRDVDASKVRIIAVTKYVDVKEIIEAYECGLRNFAENRLQDAEDKRARIPEDIEKNMIWHFIGHLQTNKVKRVVGNFEYIHSVDSEKLAKAISQEAKLKGLIQKILIQVNIASEETKFGYEIKEIKEVFKEIINLDSLSVVGLMTMAPYTQDEELLHGIFRELRELKDYLQEKYEYSLPELSMGMSNDYTIAVQEGATMLRLGQILFR